MNKYIKIAISQAEKGILLNQGGPFGACIVKNGVVIAKGHNQVVKYTDCTCHAEIQTIKKACKKLKNFNLGGCTLYCTSEPCTMCLGACLWANIDKVYFGCTLLNAQEIGFKDKKIDSLLTSRRNLKNYLTQIDYEPCKQLFNKYKNLPNKTKY